MLSPVWPGDPAVTQPFGCTPLAVEPWWPLKGCHWHCGVDIGVNVGTPLRSARAGTVATVSYGVLGIQVQGRTERDFYVHIDRSMVTVGQAVAAGQLVAYSGAKVPAGGYLTGPHLHFEVNTGGLNVPASSIDPVPVLTALHGGGGGTVTGDEMTPEQAAQLQTIYNVLTTNSALASTINDTHALVKAFVPGAVLTPAQAAQLQAIADAFGRLEAALKAA